MTRTFRARYDGKVLIPQAPVELPTDREFEVRIDSDDATEPTCNALPSQDSQTPLADLARWASSLPPLPDSPGDASIQHDHYLYGTPKRENP